MTEVNKPVIRRWAERLEANQDPQGTGYLRHADGLCCLGVLCEIAVEDGVIEKKAPGDMEYGVWEYGGYTTALPESVAEWAFGDSTQQNPALNNPEDEVAARAGRARPDVRYDASGYNDYLGYTFPPNSTSYHPDRLPESLDTTPSAPADRCQTVASISRTRSPTR